MSAEAKNLTVGETNETKRTRRSFSMPVSRLAVPEIPGYHLHWFQGTPQRIARAQEAGYEFVKKDEVSINSRLLGSDTAEDGNTDMGSNVSIVDGNAVGSDNQAIRMYLMKLPEEIWQQDQELMTGRNSRLEGVRQGLLSGLTGSGNMSESDKAKVYVDPKRTKIPDFLKRRT